MLGDGMPWHIILSFFLLGILIGCNQYHIEQKKAKNNK